MIHHLATLPGVRRGFERLAALAASTESVFADTVTIDLSRATSIAANMCAPLGTIIARLADDFNEVEVQSLRPEVERTLRRSSFLVRHPRHAGQRTSIMPFRRFRHLDEGAFEDYLYHHLRRLKRRNIVTDAADRLFKKKVFEVFQNAVMHSDSTLGIFVCGQLFPHRRRLHFTLSDAGIGIRDSVRRHFRTHKLTSVRALEWALQPRTTTKVDTPGGIGLQFLKDFSRLNGGRIQIASRRAFYQLDNHGERLLRLAHDLPGTTVTVELNAAYENPSEGEFSLLPTQGETNG